MRKLYEDYEAPVINTADNCGKCKSDRIVTSLSGFNASLMAKWFVWGVVWAILFVLFIPFVGGLFAFVSLIIGFIGGIVVGSKGKGKVINMCANCGNKWEPGK